MIDSSTLMALMSAALGAIFVGSVWYSPWAMGRFWTEAMSEVHQTEKGRVGLVLTPFNFFLAPVNALLAASALWLVFRWLEVDSLLTGVWVAAVLWGGFSFTTIMWQAIYETRPLVVMLIDGGNQLITYVVMAVILSSWKAGYFAGAASL